MIHLDKDSIAKWIAPMWILVIFIILMGSMITHFLIQAEKAGVGLYTWLGILSGLTVTVAIALTAFSTSGPGSAVADSTSAKPAQSSAGTSSKVAPKTAPPAKNTPDADEYRPKRKDGAKQASTT